MDDQKFDDLETALDWIRVIEKPGATPRDQDIYPAIAQWVERKAPEKILEIGCGQGVSSDKIPLSVGTRKYVGIEPSPVLLNRAKELYEDRNRSFIAGNAYALPFIDQSFDAVFSVLVWHLLGDLKQAAVELSRVLTSQGQSQVQGQFLTITANPAAYSVWTENYIEKKQEGRRFEGFSLSSSGAVLRDVLHLHTLDEILHSLAKAGLKVDHTETLRPSSASGLGTFLLIRGHKA
jgi:ubiquinone/menaquinone biosynthesis C-methylase UbiE